TAPLSYQWKKNGITIPNATGSTYTTPPTLATDNGAQFTVTVSNSAGNVNSAAATLTVTIPPPPALPSTLTLTVPYNTAGSVSPQITGGLSPFTWSIPTAPSHGTAITNTTGATYTPTTGYNGSDTFVLRVTDSLGLISNISTVSVTVNAPGNHPPV